MRSPETVFARVAAIENEVEAGLLDSILNDRGIPHIMQSYYDAAYDGVFQVQRGWGCVQAPEAHREVILQILEDLRTAAGVGGSPRGALPENPDADRAE